MVVKNEKLKKWVKDVSEMCLPDTVHWCDGSRAHSGKPRPRYPSPFAKTGGVHEKLKKEPGAVTNRPEL